MAKDKKNKKNKKDKKAAKGTGVLKTLAQNPMVADVVAAALVATASALKDSKRARALASDVGDELGKLSKANAERGNVLWDMALQIGRRSLESLAAEKPKTKVKAKTATPKKKPSPGAKAR